MSTGIEIALLGADFFDFFWPSERELPRIDDGGEGVLEQNEGEQAFLVTGLGDALNGVGSIPAPDSKARQFISLKPTEGGDPKDPNRIGA